MDVSLPISSEEKRRVSFAYSGVHSSEQQHPALNGGSALLDYGKSQYDRNTALLQKQFEIAKQKSNLNEEKSYPSATHAVLLRSEHCDTIILTSIIFIVILLIPIMPSELLNFNLSNSVQDVNFRSNSCFLYAIATLSVSITLIAYLLLRILLQMRTSTSFIYMRIASLFILFSCSLVYIHPTNYHNWIQVQHVLFSMQSYSEIALSLWLLHFLDSTRYWGKYWTIFLTSIIAVSYIFEFTTRIYSQSYALSILYSISLHSSWILFVLTSIIWCYSCRNVLFYCAAGKKATIARCGLAVITTLIICYSSEASIGETKGYNSIAFKCSSFAIRTILAFILTVLPTLIVFDSSKAGKELNADSKSSFVRYVSHEIRNPLSVCLVGLDLAKRQFQQGRLDEGILTTNEVIAASLSIQDILDNLLLYERIESKILHISSQEISAIDFLTDTLSKCNLLTSNDKATIDFLSSANSSMDTFKFIHIKVESKLLGPSLRKILNRAALGSSVDDTIKVDIEMISENIYNSKPNLASSLTLKSEYLRILFYLHKPLDEIEKGYLVSKSFNFDRIAHEDGDGGGFQLISWLFKQVIDLHGGKTGWLPNNASVIYVDLPCSRKEPLIADYTEFYRKLQMLRRNFKRRNSIQAKAAIPQKRASIEKLFVAVATRSSFIVKVRVLVVDDSKMNRKMITRLLNGDNRYICAEGENGKIAVDLTMESMSSGSCFDIILLDNEMPVMTGNEAARALRDGGFKGVIIGVTGNALENDIVEFQNNGADLVILKPLTVEKFNSAMISLKKEGFCFPVAP